MGWSQRPDFDNSANDTPFAAPKQSSASISKCIVDSRGANLEHRDIEKKFNFSNVESVSKQFMTLITSGSNTEFSTESWELKNHYIKCKYLIHLIVYCVRITKKL